MVMLDVKRPYITECTAHGSSGWQSAQSGISMLAALRSISCSRRSRHSRGVIVRANELPQVGQMADSRGTNARQEMSLQRYDLGRDNATIAPATAATPRVSSIA